MRPRPPNDESFDIQCHLFLEEICMKKIDCAMDVESSILILNDLGRAGIVIWRRMTDFGWVHETCISSDDKSHETAIAGIARSRIGRNL